jgi:hypothetical protein
MYDIGGIAKSNRFYTSIAKVRKLIDDDIPKAIKEFENSIKDEIIEYSMLFDSSGNELLNKSIKGKSDSFRLLPTDATTAKRKLLQSGRKIEDLVITHNHPPPGSSLSFEDILMAMSHNTKKMRAINPDGSIFEMTRIGRYPAIQEKDLITFVKDINKKIKNKYPYLIEKSIEYQLKQADLAIEQLGKNIEYIHYTN